MITYRGRFAPSPTGPLHFGSLVAAAASYLDARAQGGEWLVRMEDLDAPREVPGAAGAILRSLEAFGFAWDGPIMRQSARTERYQAALEALAMRSLTYSCGCTRREIADSALGAPSVGGELVYPGTCAGGLPAGRIARAIRVRVPDAAIAFDDALQGRIEQNLWLAIGDFVLKRADGPFAYQLAVVIDDADQGITDIVRGADLLDSTPRQIHLQRLLGVPTPRYLHVPVAIDSSGAKLSKQTRATAIDSSDPLPAIRRALAFLGHQPPNESMSRDELWRWAIAQWDRRRLPRERGVAAT